MPSQTPVEQVGGDHYGNSDYKHWDLMCEFHVFWPEANATKYLSRWREKDGLKDLKKALSYVDKRLAICEKPYSMQFAGRTFQVSVLKMLKWFRGTKMDETEKALCTTLLHWEELDELKAVRDMVANMIARQEAVEAGHNYVMQE